MKDIAVNDRLNFIFFYPYSNRIFSSSAEKEYEITKAEEDSKVSELEVMQSKDRRVSRVSTYSRKSSVDQNGRRLSVVDVLM